MELLQQYFDTAFAAPDGIPRLRELILKLAMQGKLVPQDPNDSPASELIRTIEAEKKRLVKERKIKAPKTLTEITASDEPYSLPHGWQWVRLGAIGNIFNGNSINASEKESKYAGVEGLPYIATKDVGYGFEPLVYDNGICIPPDEEKFRIAHQGAVLICAEGGSAGKKCGLTDRDICFGNKLFANELHGQIPSRFILYIYLSPAFRASFTAAMTGIIGGVSIAKFVEIPIPLPPLEEQHRIVAKVDQLIAQCDVLENLRIEREKKRLASHAAALSQLLDTTGNSSADDAWAFITQHFGDLYSVKENVTELRKAILQLAVMGKLVLQDPNDQPSIELLKEIEAERRAQVKAGKIKLPKPLPPIRSDEMPYKIPDTWQFVYLQDLCSLITDGTHQTPKYTETGRPFISAQCVKPFKFMPEKCRYVSEDAYQAYIKNRKPDIKDILLSRVGAGIGEAAIIDVDLDFAIYVSTGLLKPFKDQVLPEYMVAWLNSPVGREYSRNNTLGIGASQGNLNLNLIRQFPVSLPPIQEQHRIVAKINRLMSLCNALDEKIDAAGNQQAALLNALMGQM